MGGRDVGQTNPDVFDRGLHGWRSGRLERRDGARSVLPRRETLMRLHVGQQLPPFHTAIGNLLGRRIVAQGLLPLNLQQKLHRFSQTGETCFLRFPLPVCAGNFETGGPKTSLVGISVVKNCGELTPRATMSEPRLRSRSGRTERRTEGLRNRRDRSGYPG